MAQPAPGVIARAVRARRIELDLSVEDAAFLARIHVTAWRLLEQGVTEPSPLTLRAVNSVLGWTPATIESLVHGELQVDADGDVVVDLDRWPDGDRRHGNDQAHDPAPGGRPEASTDAAPGLDVAGLTPAQLAEVQRFIDDLRSEDG